VQRRKPEASPRERERERRRKRPHREGDEGSDQNPSSASAAQQSPESRDSLPTREPRQEEARRCRRGCSIYCGRRAARRLLARAVFSAARGGRAWRGCTAMMRSRPSETMDACDPRSRSLILACAPFSAWVFAAAELRLRLRLRGDPFDPPGYLPVRCGSGRNWTAAACCWEEHTRVVLAALPRGSQVSTQQLSGSAAQIRVGEPSSPN
jgi:hypothetical protein